MDKLTAMNVFRTVIDCGSFARASAKLAISTTTASRHVADLEQALGVSLLHRSTRKISLTEPGTMYYERCCSHLDEIAATELAVSADTATLSGCLRISVPYSFSNAFLARHFSRFVESHPALKTEIRFSDRIVDLAQEGVDLAVRITRNVSGMYVARRLAVIRTALCASPEYLARAGVPEKPDELVRHSCLLYTNLASGNGWTLRRGEQEFVVPVNGTFRSNNGDMNRIAALAGRGIICEPTFIVGDDLRAGRLVRVLPDYETIPNLAHAVFLPAGRNTARIRALLDFLVALFEDEFPAFDPVM
ncbi:MAG: hypothetical protein AzoDbin1_00170 [Azoarcus sp.]|uniref:DNA-binding transcriptional regulator, LysR family n=1 Tax=Aromatoleum tolulyticum TaxID=34027 RepID=A0A1N6U7P6_9RHOO|nr:LysR family transcriptional regulator [Aromatoleum tolulyticum]MCK9983698.1 hypothetical protein [Azoarcus sp.]SIQ61521.1 DNA-binding transcriptional regulator, LysR family [Aromatoleum tolulyticum]